MLTECQHIKRVSNEEVKEISPISDILLPHLKFKSNLTFIRFSRNMHISINSSTLSYNLNILIEVWLEYFSLYRKKVLEKRYTQRYLYF